MTTRSVTNTDLKAGDRIVSPDGWVTLTSDAEASATAPGMVCADVAAGTLYLDATLTSKIFDEPESSGTINEDYLLARYHSYGEIELYALGVALGRGRALGVTDEATIHRFCLNDVEDRERLTEFTGTTDADLRPTAELAMEFIQSYWDIGTYPRGGGQHAHPELYRHGKNQAS